MTAKEPITPEGYKKIETELEQLIKVDREQLKVIISDARDLGDLKENAEYHSAKEKQSLLEGRISQLQAIVASANIINPSDIKNEKVVFGATVTVADEDGESKVFKIVGKDESDRSKGLISYISPLGKALLGKEEGDAVTVKAPKGDIEYEVETIEYV